jgi:hypothetical protein
MSGARGQSLRRAALPLVALCVFGCGGSGSSDPDAAGTDPTGSPEPSVSDSATPADGPACDTVWQEGATLPRGYRGCVDTAGTLVPRDVLGCSSGQRLVSHADRYWAVLGGTIHEAATTPLADDPDYRTAVRSCRA